MEAPVDVMITTTPISIMSCAADLLWSPVLRKYPDLKIALSEGGIGWIPFLLEAVDHSFEAARVQDEHPEFEMRPSEYFRRQVYACYWFEETASSRLLDKVGVDNIMFETDFPHPTSLYGDEVHARIAAGLGDCEPDVRHKILWANGERLYKVEPPTAEDLEKLAAATG